MLREGSRRWEHRLSSSSRQTGYEGRVGAAYEFCPRHSPCFGRKGVLLFHYEFDMLYA